MLKTDQSPLVSCSKKPSSHYSDSGSLSLSPGSDHWCAPRCHTHVCTQLGDCYPGLQGEGGCEETEYGEIAVGMLMRKMGNRRQTVR